MFKNTFVVVVLVMVSMLTVACGKGGGPSGCFNPADPTCSPNPTPTPNPSYEPLPTEKRYLKDADGNQTHMWARFLAEPSPPRGSAMTSCPSGPNKCFTNLSLEYGLDPLNNPNTSAVFDIGFSSDGVNISRQLVHGSVNGSGRRQNPAKTDPTTILAINEVVAPMYIVVKAFFLGDRMDQSESGNTRFVVDYK